MKTFKIEIKWNNGDPQTITIPADSLAEAENWAAYYVGTLGTFEVEEVNTDEI